MDIISHPAHVPSAFCLHMVLGLDCPHLFPYRSQVTSPILDLAVHSNPDTRNTKGRYSALHSCLFVQSYKPLLLPLLLLLINPLLSL